MALTDNLISWWSLDEASGTRVDSHGSNDLSDSNSVGSTAGKIGNAAVFSVSSSNRLFVASNSDLQPGSSDFTVSLWVYVDEVFTPANRGIAGKATAGFSAVVEWSLGFDGGGTPRFYAAGTNVAISSLSSNAWVQLTAWRDGSSGVIGVSTNNGAPQTTSIVSSPTSSGNTTIGFAVRGAFQDYYFNGRVDEVGFWKRCLSPAERTQLYNSGNGLDYAGLTSPPSSPSKVPAMYHHLRQLGA